MSSEEVTPTPTPGKPMSDAKLMRRVLEMALKYGPIVAAAAAGVLATVNKVDSDQKTAAVEQKVENKGAQVIQAVNATVAPTVTKTLSTEDRLKALEATTIANTELLKDLAKKSSPARRQKLIANVDEKVAKNLKALEARAAANTPPIKPLPATLPPVTSAPPPATPSPPPVAPPPGG